MVSAFLSLIATGSRNYQSRDGSSCNRISLSIAAHMPDAGENGANDGKLFPSDLSKSTAIKKPAGDFTYLDLAQFHEYFAADLRVGRPLSRRDHVTQPG